MLRVYGNYLLYVVIIAMMIHMNMNSMYRTVIAFNPSSRIIMRQKPCRSITNNSRICISNDQTSKFIQRNNMLNTQSLNSNTNKPNKLLLTQMSSSSSSTANPSNDKRMKTNKGKILVLGGTGYLGQNVCKVAIENGYSVVSLSRRGLPSSIKDEDKAMLSPDAGYIDYRKGDARQKLSISNILLDNNDDNIPFVGIIHCIGLLFDYESGIGDYNIYVSGSNSIPDNESSYDLITRQTAFHAIDVAIEYANNNNKLLPFCFTSAAEAGWPQMTGGTLIESIMPDFIKRYMIAKRAVEDKLLSSTSVLRPIIVRPSLIYTPYQLASVVPVTIFTIANTIGIPFVDRPVTIESLSKAMIYSIENTNINGIQRYNDIDQLSNGASK